MESPGDLGSDHDHLWQQFPAFVKSQSLLLKATFSFCFPPKMDHVLFPSNITCIQLSRHSEQLVASVVWVENSYNYSNTQHKNIFWFLIVPLVQLSPETSHWSLLSQESWLFAILLGPLLIPPEVVSLNFCASSLPFSGLAMETQCLFTPLGQGLTSLSLTGPYPWTYCHE